MSAVVRKAPGLPISRKGGRPVRGIRAAFLAVALALMGSACGGGGVLEAKDLLEQSKSLQSLAAEGALLAEDGASGKTTRVFMQEHSSDLFRAASQVEATLAQAKSEQPIVVRLRKLTVLAGRVSANLELLTVASREEQRVLAGELESAARACRTIGEALS
jgi:hypothetical protein